MSTGLHFVECVHKEIRYVLIISAAHLEYVMSPQYKTLVISVDFRNHEFLCVYITAPMQQIL